MNGQETANAEALLAHKRAVHLIDGVAIRKVLLGTPVALTELERGAVITISDTYGLSRDIVAEGLSTTKRQVEREVGYRRRDLPAAERELLAASMRPVAEGFVAAVGRRDAEAVADLAAGLDVEAWCALALNLAADLIEARRLTRRPGGAR